MLICWKRESVIDGPFDFGEHLGNNGLRRSYSLLGIPNQEAAYAEESWLSGLL